MNPKIEILLATYNGEKYVGEQIDSIINQTYNNWELLIRDDNSKDRTLEILKEYEKKDKRIKIIEDKKGNLGFVKNFEELLNNSKEDWVMFSDQDDYWLENKIEKYVAILNTSSEDILKKPMLIHSNSFICDDNLEIIKDEFINSKIANKYNEDDFYFAYFVQGSTVLINRKIIDLALPFSKNVTVHDRYFHLLAEFLGKRIFINESLIKYRQHSNNKIGAKTSIISKIFKKRYFHTEDRELILEIQKKYKDNLGTEQIEKIEKYLEVTNDKKNRFLRFYLSREFKMNIKKRLFMLLK
ncbi:glycosyltransferase family 2 protein [Fusobacterium polymorphum]|jgi:glycosyltransferase, family 2|uniref:glycosyltransferase family 2 protein n=1 Tax=Fusobacterium nucleatum subsp. polymorphum TaxID=76857 RepID=UPI00300AE1E5